MNTRDVTTAVAGVKLAIFTVVSILVTGTLASIMGNIGVNDRPEYKALFSTASDLKKGDDVRVAGISVGDVEDVQVAGGDHALVTFKVDKDVPLTTASGAAVRYLNLVGDRYLALTQGRPGAPRLQEGQTLPMSQTTPALDLTQLFNGFQPLFNALDPKDVNKLSLNLVRVLQGEGGTVESLLKQTASLTSALADRDKLIGDVITNLSSTLETVNAHHSQLADLLTQLNGWMRDLARDKDTIGDSIQSVSQLTDQLAGLLTDVRTPLRKDVAQLKKVMTILNKPSNQAIMSETIQRLPKTLESQARIGSYGSWYNYYLCDLNVQITLPSLGKALDNSPAVKALQKQLDHISLYSKAKRCSDL